MDAESRKGTASASASPHPQSDRDGRGTIYGISVGFSLVLNYVGGFFIAISAIQRNHHRKAARCLSVARPHPRPSGSSTKQYESVDAL